MQVFPSPESVDYMRTDLCSALARSGHRCHETCFASCCVHALLVVWCLFLKTLKCEKFSHVSLVEMYYVHDRHAGILQGPSSIFRISGEDGGKSPTVLNLCCLLVMLLCTCCLALGWSCEKTSVSLKAKYECIWQVILLYAVVSCCICSIKQVTVVAQHALQLLIC